MGPYLSSCLKLCYKDEFVEGILLDCEKMLNDVGIGGIPEVYDGDEPRYGEGCPWQAWSIAELLRVAREVLNAKSLY